jgi:hypothetical protein
MANLTANIAPSRYPAQFMTHTDHGSLVPKAQGLKITIR